MSRRSAAESLHDRAAAWPDGPERDGRLIVARSILAEACPECRGYGAQARADGARYDGAGPDCPCPDCGARASDSWPEEPEFDAWELDLAPHPGFGFEQPPVELL